MFEIGRTLSSTLQGLPAFLHSSAHAATTRHSDPAASDPFADAHAGPPAERERPRALALRTLAVGTAALLGLMGIGVMAARAYVPAALRAYIPAPDQVAASLGLGIDQVTLTGHRFAFDNDIFDALDLGNVRSFWSLDAKAAKARIERVPWVATAELTRVYPNRLDVRVTERKPFALWTRGGRQFLVDETGRVLAAVDSATIPDLPRIAGEGAAKAAKALFELVARYPEMRSSLVEAERVGDRRWNLKLASGTVLKLPVDGEAKILDAISREAAVKALVSGPAATLDFRADGRVAVAPAPPAAAAPAAPASPGT